MNAIARARGLFHEATAPLTRSLSVALLLTFAASLALRYGVMESDLLHGLCATASEDWRCALRALAPHVFMHERIGLASLSLGVASLLLRSPVSGGMAMIGGVEGLVLYAADFAAVGLLLGLLVRSTVASSAK